MTRLPRDLGADGLVKALARLGYERDRQTGSHIRLTTEQRGEHHVTIPAHNPMRVGTLGAILADIAEHFGVTRDELMDLLFG
jgi:predicted RNA binding protein YcfA (HicA-like mRNA interferase family)